MAIYALHFIAKNSKKNKIFFYKKLSRVVKTLANNLKKKLKTTFFIYIYHLAYFHFINENSFQIEPCGGDRNRNPYFICFFDRKNGKTLITKEQKTKKI